MPRPKLESLTIRGYKSIRELNDFKPGDLTVLIGANGAGKSNLISFFKMLSWAMNPPGQLQEWVARQGGAAALLHDGPERTGQMSGSISIRSDTGMNDYAFRLAFVSGDSLIFTDERYRYSRADRAAEAGWVDLGVGHREPALLSGVVKKTPTVLANLIRRIIVHQLHNTSDTARIRQSWDVEDNLWLKEDAGNLAPVLGRLRDEHPVHYTRICQTLRLALPFFSEFVLEASRGRMLLRWREIGTDRVFHAGQAADGMLRLMALVTILQQPEKLLPDVLILDEPELGLHPYAITILADLLRSASRTVQVIIATQSVGLLDHFEPGNVVIVTREGRESTYDRLRPEGLAEWRAEYSLSELWEKNVIGGRP